MDFFSFFLYTIEVSCSLPSLSSTKTKTKKKKKPLRTRQKHAYKVFQSPLVPKVCGCYSDDYSSFPSHIDHIKVKKFALYYQIYAST